MNGSQFKVFEDLVNQTRLVSTGYWVSGIVKGILTLRANVDGSQLYRREGHVNVSGAWLFPLEKTEILVGAYIGTLVPAFFIVAFTAGTVLTHIIPCIF